MSPASTVELVNRSRLAEVVVSNAPVILTATGASFAFAGFTYYDALFGAFGIKPFTIELNNIDIVSHGALAILWAAWTLIRDYWLAAIIVLVASASMGAGLGFALTRLPWLKAALQGTKPYLDAVSRVNNQVLRWLIGTVILGAGFTAGNTTANQEIAYFQQARQRSLNCYSIGGKVIRGLPLAQDKDTIILVRPTSTVVLSFGAIEIGTCRREK